MQNTLNNGTHRIVLTGGPGGGKTTAADLIRREIGQCIVVVPEAATMLFSGGFPRVENVDAVKNTQQAIYQVQKNIENIQHQRFPGRVLLCDRGTIDGASYWPDNSVSFFSAMNTTIEAEYQRYDAVIFFETAAVGNIAIEGGNPIRNESIQKAIELDQKLKNAWSGHGQFYHIPHQASFMQKLQNALSVFQSVLKQLQSNKVKN